VPQPASDLGDRQALLVAVVARELRGAAALANAVCHKPPGSFVSLRWVVQVRFDGSLRGVLGTGYASPGTTYVNSVNFCEIQQRASGTTPAIEAT
jgi:hypothetical protein